MFTACDDLAMITVFLSFSPLSLWYLLLTGLAELNEGIILAKVENRWVKVKRVFGV